MKFYANPSNIPEDNVVPVRNNIVYVENGFNYTIENREIRTPYQEYLSPKEVHDFVKVVVSNNKVSVLQHMMNNGFQLKVVDLAYLACQHGCYEMTKLLMDKGVQIYRRLQYYTISTLCTIFRESLIILQNMAGLL